MPTRARWWLETSREYAAKGRAEGKWGDVGAANIERCLRVWPDRFEAAGLGRPVHAGDVSAEMILAWKSDPWGPGHYGRRRNRLRQTTAFQALWILRGFLRYAGNPTADLEGVWRLKRGDATRRRWFDGPTVDRLYTAARLDEEKLVLALTAWAGLRRQEICSLRVGDADLDMAGPSLTVQRKGGRRQVLPIARSVANAVRPFAVGREPDERLYPKSYSALGSALRRLGHRVGVGALSAHDLRRTFGRILYYERGCDVNAIRVLFGHASTEMTLYYIGASMDKLRSTVECRDRPPQATPLSAPIGVP